MAHYDTDPTTPGANDNTSAVATLLESGRAILAGSAAPQRRDPAVHRQRRTQPPAWLQGIRPRESGLRQHRLVVNLEAIGGSGPSSLVETTGSEPWLVGQYSAAVSNPTAFSFIAEITALIGDFGTDFDPFRNAGVPGFHFAYMRGSPIYHSPADDLGSVGWDSVQHHGSNALGSPDTSEISTLERLRNRASPCTSRSARSSSSTPHRGHLRLRCWPRHCSSSGSLAP